MSTSPGASAVQILQTLSTQTSEQAMFQQAVAGAEQAQVAQAVGAMAMAASGEVQVKLAAAAATYASGLSSIEALEAAVAGAGDVRTLATSATGLLGNPEAVMASVRQLLGASELPMVAAGAVDFGSGTRVMSAAQKFVIPVSITDGEALVYPQGTVKKGVDVSGQPITDWEGKPIGERGIVFANPVDGAWQAAVEGSGVIIMNEVSEADASALIFAWQHFTRDGITLASIKLFLRYAAETVGAHDTYNSDRGFIANHMTPARASDEYAIADGDGNFGFVKRDARDIFSAVYFAAPFQFQGPAATAQQMPSGGVVVNHGGKVRAIQPDVFMRTHTLADGSAITDLTADLGEAPFVAVAAE